MSKTNKDPVRFWSKVDEGKPDECWEWQASTNVQTGYGQINWGKKRSALAHRVAVELDGRDPTEGTVMHSCDNPSCVNPAHLDVGDHSQNILDACRRDPDNGTTTLTPDDVEEIQMKYDTTEATQAELADEYGTSRSNIGRITRGETWS